MGITRKHSCERVCRGMSSDEVINYLGSSKAHNQFFLPFKVNLPKITQCYPSWCIDFFSLKIFNTTVESEIILMTVYLYFTLTCAFRSTVHCGICLVLTSILREPAFFCFPDNHFTFFFLYFESGMYYLSCIFIQSGAKIP